MKTFSLTLIAAVLLAIAQAQQCLVVVPPHPLTPAGLATPYLLQTAPGSDTPCDAANLGSLAFVHGVILDTDTGAVSVYNPLIITDGTAPFIQPSIPTLPANNIVALWFGFNGATITIVDTPNRPTSSLAEGNCVPGTVDPATGAVDNMGQFAYCNAPAWFDAARNMILAGKLVPPKLGTATDGQICPNVRSWDVVDQDQSDNVPTKYLLDATGTLAQFSAANMAAMNNPQVLLNPSDNILVSTFIMPAVGCSNSVWLVPDLVDQGAMTTALPLNELQAEMFATFPQALVPLNHGFTTVGLQVGAFSAPKTNLYRLGVGQPPISTVAATIPNTQGNPTTYCQNINTRGAPRIKKFKAAFQAANGPMGMTLFDFLVQRYNNSMNVLDCFNLIGVNNVVQNF